MGIDQSASLCDPAEPYDGSSHPERAGLQLITCTKSVCAREQAAALPNAQFAHHALIDGESDPVFVYTNAPASGACTSSPTPARHGWTTR